MFIFQFFLLLIGLWILGLGLLLWFVPKISAGTAPETKTSYETFLFLAPLVPLPLLSIVGWYNYRWLNVGVNSSTVPMIVALGAVSLSGYVRHLKSVRFAALFVRLLRPNITTENIFVVIGVVLSFSLLASSLQWFGNSGLPVAIEGIDWPSYAQISNFLAAQHNGFPQTGFHLQNEESYRYLISENVFGVFYTIAFLVRLTGLEVPSIMPLLLQVHWCITLFLVFRVQRDVFKIPIKPNLLLLTLYGLSPLLLLVTSSGYIGQAIAVPLFLSLLILIYELAQDRVLTKGNMSWLPSALLIGLFLTAVVHFYSHMLGPILMVLGFFFLCLRKEVWKELSLKQILKVTGVVAVFVLLGSGDRLYWMIFNSKTLFTVNAGPSLPTLNADILFGFYFSNDLKSLEELIRQSANLIAVIYLGKSLFLTKRENLPAFFLALSVLGTVIAVLASFSIFGVPARGYKTFKLLTFLLALLIPIVFVSPTTERRGRTFLIVLGLVNALHFGSLAGSLYSDGKRVPLGQKVLELPMISQAQNINVITVNSPWDRQWMASFFQDKNLFFFDDLFGGPGTDLISDIYLFGPSIAKESASTAEEILSSKVSHLNALTGNERRLSPCSSTDSGPTSRILCFHSSDPGMMRQPLEVHCDQDKIFVTLVGNNSASLKGIFRIVAEPSSAQRWLRYELHSDNPEPWILKKDRCPADGSCSGSFQNTSATGNVQLILFTETKEKMETAAPTHCGVKFLDLISWVPKEPGALQ
ncbi:MAG: hypothetical protein K2X47_11370 [Bdellovibrionales bacterium]|nr:hypothetical protein [Bdellovibrionales bacterium]